MLDPSRFKEGFIELLFPAAGSGFWLLLASVFTASSSLGLTVSEVVESGVSDAGVFLLSTPDDGLEAVGGKT